MSPLVSFQDVISLDVGTDLSTVFSNTKERTEEMRKRGKKSRGVHDEIDIRSVIERITQLHIITLPNYPTSTFSNEESIVPLEFNNNEKKSPTVFFHNLLLHLHVTLSLRLQLFRKLKLFLQNIAACIIPDLSLSLLSDLLPPFPSTTKISKDFQIHFVCGQEQPKSSSKRS